MRKWQRLPNTFTIAIGQTRLGQYQHYQWLTGPRQDTTPLHHDQYSACCKRTTVYVEISRGHGPAVSIEQILLIISHCGHFCLLRWRSRIAHERHYRLQKVRGERVH